jgi:hypothetical protein
MKHVFVETNWVVDLCAPAHHRQHAAERLAARAREKEVQLHLPAICLREAVHVLSQRFKPKGDDLKAFRKWALEKGKITVDESRAAVRFIETYERALREDLLTIEQRIDELVSSGLADIFALSDPMLNRTFSLRAIELEPFDESILAAILVKAEDLQADGAVDLSFCELDGDLKPWDRGGNLRQPLCRIYDEARIWVYGDFDMRWPEKRAGWPGDVG